MFYNLPSGLVLYYLTGTIVAIAQQWFFNHTEAAQEAARAACFQKTGYTDAALTLMRT